MNLRPLVPQTSALTGLRYAPNRAMRPGCCSLVQAAAQEGEDPRGRLLCPLIVLQHLIDQRPCPDQVIERRLELAAIHRFGALADIRRRISLGTG